MEEEEKHEKPHLSINGKKKVKLRQRRLRPNERTEPSQSIVEKNVTIDVKQNRSGRAMASMSYLRAFTRLITTISKYSISTPLIKAHLLLQSNIICMMQLEHTVKRTGNGEISPLFSLTKPLGEVHA